MIIAIVNHLWQSTVVVLAAALVALALRRNRASVRHGVWLAASLKFLLPFSLLMGLGGAFAWRTAPGPTGSVAPAIVETVETIAEPFAESSAGPAQANVAEQPTPISWLATIAAVWIWGCLVVIAMRIHGWLKVRTAVRASMPTTVSGVENGLEVRATPGLLEPGVVGIWRPVLLLPVGLESTLSADQLRAVVVHEMHHIRRRDNLTSALHMVVEVLFWFHPLVWWVGAHLIDERERACDEHVLASGAAPDEYAEGILNVCKRYVELPVACVSGVTGSDLKRRIGAILAGRVGLDLSGARKVVLVLASAAALGVPVAAGVLNAPIRTSTQGPGPLPKFEVVSVRPCDATPTPPAPGAGRGGALGGGASPGRLNYSCWNLLSLIRLAYGLYANGRVNSISERPAFPRPSDVPDWISRDKFTIEAKAEGEPPALVMVGPMLQRVLEDQFKLKVHRETREVPVYELVVAKGGSKLTPVKPDTCVQYDFSVSPQPAPAPGQHRCTNHGEMDANGDYVQVMEMITVDDFFLAWSDTPSIGRPVVNKTGITGPVAFRFVVPGQASSPDEALAARIAAMRRELGLELRPGKDRVDFLVIDHAERPDSAEASASASSRQAPVPSASGPETADRQKFDVVSIRSCQPNSPSAAGAPAPSGFRGAGPSRPQTTPGPAYWACVTLSQLVDQAYAGPDQPLLNAVAQPRQDLSQPKRVRGGPSWVETEPFTIEATASPGVIPSALAEALRLVLADRFQVKVHRATEEQPMYALTVAKGGLNTAKITTPVSGDCMSRDEYAAWATQNQYSPTNHPAICGIAYSSLDHGMEYSSFTLHQLTVDLSSQLDRYVLDQTGLDNKFNFVLHATGSTGPGDPGPWARALGELGLKLDTTKGTSEYLVIDHAERPDSAEASSRQARSAEAVAALTSASSRQAPARLPSGGRGIR